MAFDWEQPSCLISWLHKPITGFVRPLAPFSQGEISNLSCDALGNHQLIALIFTCINNKRVPLYCLHLCNVYYMFLFLFIYPTNNGTLMELDPI